MPSFQEEYEFHLGEYHRLKKIYEPDPLPPSRGERLLSGGGGTNVGNSRATRPPGLQ